MKFRPISRYFLILVLAVATCASATAQNGPSAIVPRDFPGSGASTKPPLSATSSAALFDAAVRNYNAGKFWDCRTILEDLLALTPDNWVGHALYWDAVERTADINAKKEVVRATLAKMLPTADERRTEDFFTVIIRGYGILDDKRQAADYTTAAMKKFPRGEMAKRKLLADIRQEPAIDKAIAAYDAQLAESVSDVLFSYQLASDKFDRLAGNRTFYDAAAMTTAAAQFESIAKAYSVKTGDGTTYLSMLRWIAETLSYTAPQESIRYAQLGVEQYGSLPSSTRANFRGIYIQLWPAIMRSALALQDYAAARTAGAKMAQELEDRPVMPPAFDEAAARKDYATALEKLRLYNPAREQLAAAVLAAKVRTLYQTELKAFNSRHPLPQIEQIRFDRALSAKLTAADNVRDSALKAELLKAEIRRPAVPFRLTDINGRSVEFDDFRGKVLVLGFWATWCSPCIREMEEMKVAYQTYSGDPKVAFAVINVDSDKTEIPRKARESGYKFPILLSDGKIEGAYNTSRIPKLLIIDGAGNVRFDRTGYSGDGTYLRKLDWMIDAARK